MAPNPRWTDNFGVHNRRRSSTGTEVSLSSRPVVNLLTRIEWKLWKSLLLIIMLVDSTVFIINLGSGSGNKNWRIVGSLQFGAGHVSGWVIGGSSCGISGGDGCLWATHGWQGWPGLQVQQRPCESVNVNVSCWAKPEATKQPKRTATVNAAGFNPVRCSRDNSHPYTINSSFFRFSNLFSSWRTFSFTACYHKTQQNRTDFDGRLESFFYTREPFFLSREGGSCQLTTKINQQRPKVNKCFRRLGDRYLPGDSRLPQTVLRFAVN